MSTKKLELVEPNHPQAGDPEFGTVEEAGAFLQEAARSPANFAHLQALWAQINPKSGKDSAFQDKRKMFRELAARLVNGKLRLRERGGQFGQVMSAADATPGLGEARATWTPSMGLRIRERPEPEPPRAPEPPTNVAQQVQALLQAAESGAPFCERCQDNPPQTDQ